jgi:hypothetical protein
MLWKLSSCLSLRLCLQVINPVINGCESRGMQKVNELARKVGTFNRNNRTENSTVCVAGPVGVGKSSFIVTLASALTGYLEVVAGAGTGTESFTREAFDHVLEYDDEPCSWKIRDTPGDIFDVRSNRPCHPCHYLHSLFCITTPTYRSQSSCRNSINLHLACCTAFGGL